MPDFVVCYSTGLGVRCSVDVDVMSCFSCGEGEWHGES